ncbi:MAG: hypothetical protein HC799_03045 [Limnothrix sp. RL_2_0]|nr:hypothetical protein [Limnothrix sp. RL_2_0]
MSFQAALETALMQNIITPEMETIISQSLWSQDLNQQQMNCLAILLERLENGVAHVIEA